MPYSLINLVSKKTPLGEADYKPVPLALHRILAGGRQFGHHLGPARILGFPGMEHGLMTN